MKTRNTCGTMSIWLLMAVSLSANPVADNPVLKKLVGEWTGEGELVDSDGNKQPVKEAWTGRFTETGIFIISGRRQLDQQEHEFAWEFYSNGELIEGQMKISEPQIDIRFEVSISEADRSVIMKIPTNSSGALMTIVNTLSEDGKTISGTVEIKDETGKVTSSGKVQHKTT